MPENFLGNFFSLRVECDVTIVWAETALRHSIEIQCGCSFKTDKGFNPAYARALETKSLNRS